MIATTNISLKVPFKEKDQAKALGARWNAESKQWYVPQGVDAAPFEKWFTDSTSLTQSEIEAKPIVHGMAISTKQNTSIDDDIDAINAKLRDAYELREIDEI